MEHYYKSVPGWAAFADLYMQVVQQAPAGHPLTFVEVGSWLGRSAACMGVEIINSEKSIMLHCVDPWEDGGPDLRDTHHFKDLKTPPYAQFVENTQKVWRVIQPHKMTSVEAAAEFRDESVDFLMLDGDHSYEAVAADLDAWLPKMRRGSIISGDDYLWPGVKQAVGERFKPPRVQVVIKKANANYLNSSSYWVVQL